MTKQTKGSDRGGSRGHHQAPRFIIDKTYTPISTGGPLSPPQGGTGTTAKPSVGHGEQSGGKGSGKPRS